MLIEKKAPKFRLSRILAIEDDQNLAEILQEVFDQAGYRSLVLGKTDDIISLMHNFKPDLVLLDYLLSGINGGELCSQIKRDSLFAKIPVIIYSAYSKVLMSLGDYGCDLFIPKPFDLDELTAGIEMLLCKKQAGPGTLPVGDVKTGQVTIGYFHGDRQAG